MREPQSTGRRLLRRDRVPDTTPQHDLGEVHRKSRRTRPPRQDSRIPLVLLAALLVFGAVGASAATIHFHRSSDLLAAVPPGPASNAVIFVVDGAGPGDLAAVSSPNIRDLERHGVTYTDAWVGQLQEVGPVSNATIATGAFPSRHGVTGTEWRNIKTGLLERPAAPDQVQLGALDQVMESRSTTPLAALLKDHYRGARVLSAGGAGCANANAAGSWLADYIICPVRRGNRWRPGSVTGHALPPRVRLALKLSVPVVNPAGPAGYEGGWRLGSQDDWLTRYMILAMRRTRPVLTILNFPEIAQVAPHTSASARAEAMRTLVHGIDTDIGRVVAELKREKQYQHSVFVLTSDQAVASLNARTSMGTLNRAVVAAGGGTVYSVPGESAMLGLQDTLQGQPVAQAIQDEHIRGIDGLYYKVRSGRFWSYQPQYLDPDLLPSFAGAVSFELRTMTSATSPDVVIVGSPGSGIVPGSAGSLMDVGSGQGAQWDTQHIPLIVAGHGVAQGVTSAYPASLVDVAPTVASLLGLGSPGGDGVALADSMLEPPTGAATTQNDRRRHLHEYVAALRARQLQVSR